MRTSFFLTNLSQVACATPADEENATGPKTAIKPADIKYECPTEDSGYSECAIFTNYTYPKKTEDYEKKGSVSWSFGHKMSSVQDPSEPAFKPSFTVDVTMTIPYDPVFLVEMSNLTSDETDTPFIKGPSSGNLSAWRWTQPGDVEATATGATAAAEFGTNLFVCPVMSVVSGPVWSPETADATGLLDIKDFAKWEPTMIKLTTMFLSNAQVKQGYFEFKGISEFPCAVCIPNVATGTLADLPTEKFYGFDLYLSGDQAFSESLGVTSGTPEAVYGAVYPPERTSAPVCNKESHSHVYGSNTPGIFKIQKITQKAIMVDSPYGTTKQEGATNAVATHAMTMNLDYLHIRSIIYGEDAPQATVQLETFPTATEFLQKAQKITLDTGAFKREASFFVVAVQAGLYNLGGFFNASADSLKEGIRFGFTDITTEADSKDFETAGFIHYQYTLLPPNDLIAATLPEKSPGLALDPEAACLSGEEVDPALVVASITDLIANNDKLTYQLIKQGDTALEATANNYGFQSVTEKVFNACGEIGGASMYVFADATMYFTDGTPDMNKTSATLPWMRGQKISFGESSADVAADLVGALGQMAIGSDTVKRIVDFKGAPRTGGSEVYPKLILNYAMSYLQMNAVDGSIVGAIPFVSTDAPGPAWTKQWKFQDATGVSGFADPILIDADFDNTPSVNYHIGGGSWMMIIIICSVVAALLLAGVGYYFYTNKGDSAQAASAGSVADDTDEA